MLGLAVLKSVYLHPPAFKKPLDVVKAAARAGSRRTLEMTTWSSRVRLRPPPRIPLCTVIVEIFVEIVLILVTVGFGILARAGSS